MDRRGNLGLLLVMRDDICRGDGGAEESFAVFHQFAGRRVETEFTPIQGLNAKTVDSFCAIIETCTRPVHPHIPAPFVGNCPHSGKRQRLRRSRSFGKIGRSPRLNPEREKTVLRMTLSGLERPIYVRGGIQKYLGPRTLEFRPQMQM